MILDDSMEPAQPFHDYLLYRLLESGKALDQKTWEAGNVPGVVEG
ncbi:hypothetical protein [Burkholderia multivorans]|nr:hypothetical protein [Burkholderia multivorans]